MLYTTIEHILYIVAKRAMSFSSMHYTHLASYMHSLGNKVSEEVHIEGTQTIDIIDTQPEFVTSPSKVDFS